jgi:DNA-binding HxlR family transcriptional regulator
MTARTYGQFCGLARALEIIGERWSVLVIRDLVLSPKRFDELKQTLPRIPSSILSARLNELEQAGVIRRRVLPQLNAAVVYELTEYGSDLEPVLLQLGIWGARSLGEPGPDDTFSLDIAILAMHACFRPEFATNVSINYEVRFGDLMTLHVLVDDGALKVEEGALPDADLVIETMLLKHLMAGQVTPAEATANGMLELRGDPALFDKFLEMFHIPSAPAPTEGLAVR